MGKPLLTIETLAPDRPTIEIDKVEYELALPGDFSLREEAENARLLRKGTEMLARAQAAGDGLELDKALEAELEDLLAGVVAVIVRAPGLVLGKLRWRQKLAIIKAFTPAVSKAATTPQPETTSRSTSVTLPRASRRRTARATGSGSPAASSSQ